MSPAQDDRDRSAQGAAQEEHLRRPDNAAAAVPGALLAEKSLFQLSSELKNLVRGDRIFRLGTKR
tara:strand:- start:175852 stop:176046 length:195 start_codon:yes stop_codon:yes gene_type:complete